MTERGLPHSDGASACPFVAFEDERDERSDRPDHRHRCYAETPPAPRAIAHQEAYCLSSAFAVCPTFQDWAQREAARTRMAGQAQPAPSDHADQREGAPGTWEPGSPPEDQAGAAGSAARSVADHPRRDDGGWEAEPADEWRGRRPADEEQAPLPPPPRRNPPRDWAAPPPWAAGTGSAAAAGLAAGAGASGAAHGAGAATSGAATSGAATSGAATSGAGPRPEGGPDPDAPRFLAERQSRGLAGSAADRLAAGEPAGARPPDAPQRTAPVMQATPARTAHAGARQHEGDEELASLVRGRRPDRDDDDTTEFRADARIRPAGRGPDDAPSWEEPRRYEAYPTIRSRPSMPGLPRIGIMVAALALAALVLFALPGLLGWFGETEDPGVVPSPSPGAIETASPVPTEPPAPTARMYTIRSGDTLSKIADRFGISLDDLLAANRETIKNPDRIVVGDQIIIPPPSEGGLEEEP